MSKIDDFMDELGALLTKYKVELYAHGSEVICGIIDGNTEFVINDADENAIIYRIGSLSDNLFE